MSELSQIWIATQIVDSRTAAMPMEPLQFVAVGVCKITNTDRSRPIEDIMVTYVPARLKGRSPVVLRPVADEEKQFVASTLRTAALR